eukprot:1571041-Prymnesium_polylepis.1
MTGRREGWACDTPWIHPLCADAPPHPSSERTAPRLRAAERVCARAGRALAGCALRSAPRSATRSAPQHR